MGEAEGSGLGRFEGQGKGKEDATKPVATRE
jgi:hypothetical protein